jgi:hypothetical protein
MSVAQGDVVCQSISERGLILYCVRFSRDQPRLRTPQIDVRHYSNANYTLVQTFGAVQV